MPKVELMAGPRNEQTLVVDTMCRELYFVAGMARDVTRKEWLQARGDGKEVCKYVMTRQDPSVFRWDPGEDLEHLYPTTLAQLVRATQALVAAGVEVVVFPLYGRWCLGVRPACDPEGRPYDLLEALALGAETLLTATARPIAPSPAAIAAKLGMTAKRHSQFLGAIMGHESAIKKLRRDLLKVCGFDPESEE